jgi:hypothetical protein
MTARFRRLAPALAAALLAGCSSTPTSNTPPLPPSFQALAQGTYHGCRDRSSADESEVFQIAGTRLEVRTYSHPTTSGTCGGSAAITQITRGDLVFGASRLVANPVDPVHLASVTAHELDLHEDSGATSYQLGWLDTSTTPNQFWIGDASGSLDGTTPTKRPTSFEASPRIRITDPVAWPGVAQGAWATCRAFGPDERTVLSLEGAALRLRNYRYPSSDGTCTGSFDPANARDGTFTFGAEVATTVGPAATVGWVFDVDFSGTMAYHLAWVDAFLTPNAFYVGDDSFPLHDGSTPAKRPVVLQYEPRFRTPAIVPPVYTTDGIAGTWRSCNTRNTGAGLQDYAEAMTFSGGIWTSTVYRYTSADRTCSAGQAVDSASSGTYAFTGTRTSVFQAGSDRLTVTVGAVFVTQTSPSASSFLSAIYVDPYSTPPALYTEDQTPGVLVMRPRFRQ